MLLFTFNRSVLRKYNSIYTFEIKFYTYESEFYIPIKIICTDVKLNIYQFLIDKYSNKLINRFFIKTITPAN